MREFLSDLFGIVLGVFESPIVYVPAMLVFVGCLFGLVLRLIRGRWFV